jgi:hypothetical protein
LTELYNSESFRMNTLVSLIQELNNLHNWTLESKNCSKIYPMNKSFSPIIFVCLLLLSFITTAQTSSKTSDNLESRFLNPPNLVKPYVWWHWMGSNFSKSGITKDLEAMKAEGIGGATIFNLSSAGLVDPVRLIAETEVKL